MLYFDETIFVNPHYQSIRPRPVPQSSSRNSATPNQQSNAKTSTSIISRLSALSNSMPQNVSTARISLDSVPDNSNLMPPPNHHSSINENRKRKLIKESEQNAKKCKEAEPLTKVSSNSNSTDIETSSFIPNSQECINISTNNIVSGKRQRKSRKK